MTARDSYGAPKSSFEAIAELRRVSGPQLDGDLVELFVEMLADKDLAYRHGEDADFEAELALDKRIHDYVRPAVRRNQRAANCQRSRIRTAASTTTTPGRGRSCGVELRHLLRSKVR